MMKKGGAKRKSVRLLSPRPGESGCTVDLMCVSGTEVARLDGHGISWLSNSLVSRILYIAFPLQEA